MTDPIARCPHCGTDFTPSHLLDEIERMKTERDDWYIRALKAEVDNERLRADNAEAHRKLSAIAKHPNVPMLIKQYASGALDGRALEPKP